MQYMLLIYLDENSISQEQCNKCYAESAAYARELHSRGQLISVGPLQPASTARSVRTQAGKRMITDGPFAETREQLGGFFLIEADNQEKAVEIAGQIPAGRWGAVEVRPVLDISGLPAA